MRHTIRNSNNTGNSAAQSYSNKVAQEFYNPTQKLPYSLRKREGEKVASSLSCQNGHKGTQEKNSIVIKCIPDVDFRPKWEQKRLKRSFATGEYTIRDANDTPIGFRDEHQHRLKKLDRHFEQLAVRTEKKKREKPKPRKYSSPAPHHAPVRVGVEFRVSENDVKVKVFNRSQTRKTKANERRGKIRGFSRKSRERLASHIVNLPRGSAEAFCTLTYPEQFPTDGALVKYHLKLFRQWLKRQGVGAVWFLEFQRRGAPHFHMLLTKYVSVVKVANAWHNITGVQDPDHLAWHLGELSGRPCVEMLRNQSGFQKYATKYALKPEQKEVPDDYKDVGRFWGYFNLKPDWVIFHGLGRDHASAAMSLVMLWREEMFGGVVPNEAIEMLNYSTTMRGGASVIDAMLRAFNFKFRVIEE